MEISNCPYCGGKAKLNARQSKFHGRNGFGTPKLSWTIYAVCNKCHSRGKPITTEPMPLHNDKIKKYDTGNFWATIWANGKNEIATENFRPYAEKAIEAWNRRAE